MLKLAWHGAALTDVCLLQPLLHHALRLRYVCGNAHQAGNTLQGAISSLVRSMSPYVFLCAISQVTSPDDQAEVVVEALMPGGLEPMDPNVFTDADAATICGSGNDETPLTDGSKAVGLGPKRFLSMLPMPMDGGFSGRGGFWRPIWPICPQQTTFPDRVTFRFSYMRAGTHTMRFKAVAATSGTFVLPPVKAFVQQQPEVMGLSPAGTLTVCAKANEACAAGEAAGQAAAVPAKACPQDCNGNGACNLLTGVCICDTGFAGQACADISTQ